MTQAKHPARKSMPDSPATPAPRSAPPLTWTIERQFDFAAALAITCNVEQAAAAVGMTRQSAYALRKDPEKGEYFQMLWEMGTSKNP
ncbi:MAG: hypothetical protein QHC67_16975 [Sphingobium sp.]|uniref:hypothetical protein n=1 Tax=Sphingobium sp. TaxID=1912891 RepID=UPI0029A9D825|nr:hypothetical protein [Sphingobium sp.]MDX3911480.1 hypothetical protein [Sphingobium sp.]